MWFTKTINAIDKKLKLRKELLNVPSHSVLTERLMRDVDRVASQSTSGEIRDGMVRSLLEDRRQKPKLDTKTDLVA